MSSIVTSILSSTLGLLWNNVIDWTLEKPKGGDVTDAKTREFLAKELNEMKTKLDLSSEDLLSSYTFLQEGVDALNAALNKSNLDEKASPNEAKDDGGQTSTKSSTVGSDTLREVLQLSRSIEKMKLDSNQELQSAKKRFEDARGKATEAFCIEALSIKDRIFAAKLRIVSEILEYLHNPENAIEGCMSILKKLHSLPAIQEMFNVYISNEEKEPLNKDDSVENVKSTMLINYVVFEYVLKFSRTNQAVCWPTIQLPDRIFSPILEWMTISERESMGKELDENPGRFCLGDEVQPYSVVMNSRSELIFFDPYSKSIKFVSRTGARRKMVEIQDPKEYDNITEIAKEALAVDMNDKVYILRGIRHGDSEGTDYVLTIFSENSDVTHTLPLDFIKPLTEEEECIKMAINKNNDVIICQSDVPYVYICDDAGRLKHKFATEDLEGRPILCACANNDIVITRDCNDELEIFTEEGNLKSTIQLPDMESVLSVAFHHVMSRIIVLTRDYDTKHHVYLYSETGELENTALIRDDFGWCPAVTCHPRGTFAVVTSHHMRFIY